MTSIMAVVLRVDSIPDGCFADSSSLENLDNVEYHQQRDNAGNLDPLCPWYASDVFGIPQQAAITSNGSHLTGIGNIEQYALDLGHNNVPEGTFHLTGGSPMEGNLSRLQEYENFSFPDFTIYNDLGNSVGFYEPTSVPAPLSDWNNTTSNSGTTVTNTGGDRHGSTIISTAPAANINSNLLQCDNPNCESTITFAREGDLNRHKKKHGIRGYPCPVVNCKFRGARAFYRLDNLRAHQRRKHG